MLRRGVSENQRYQGLFQDWEIAIAKRLINEFRGKWTCLRNEGFDDLLQECLIHWYLRKDRHNPKREASIKTYMGRIVRNKLTDLVRERESDKRKLSHMAHSLDEPIRDRDSRTLIDKIEEDANQDISTDPSSSINVSVDLRKAMEKLGPRQKELCRLLGPEGLTVKEASEYLKTPRSTVYDELKRIRGIFMKEGLEDYLR
jgi:RNA polymerase sigma-70 factor (ECF subfamily)